MRTGNEQDPEERGQPPIGGLLLLLQAVRGWLGLGTGRGLARWDGVTVCQGRGPCAALLPGELPVVVGGTQLEWMGENRRVREAEITK